MCTELKPKQPTISVIVPVYKVEQYLPACINSILAQTYTDFELILVDDGSPDNCGAICDSYAARDPRIRVIHQENMGLSGARNSGMDVAKGEYITFIDSDDLVVPQYLEYLLNAMDSQDVGISICKPIEFNNPEDNNISSSASSSGYSHLSGKDACIALYNGSAAVPINAWGKLFRKDLLESLHFPVGRIHEDQAMIPIACYRAKLVSVLGAKLYLYRYRDASITKEHFSLKRYDDIWAIDQCIAFFTEKNEPEIVEAAQNKRKRILAVYSIYARRDGVEVPAQYRVGLLSALLYLRNHVQPLKFEYYLAQVSPKLARLFQYELKLRRMLGR